MTTDRALDILAMSQQARWKDGIEPEDVKKAVETIRKALEQEPCWIPVSERLPTKEEYIDNNGLFIVSDGNRTYAEYFDTYNSMKYFGEPTMGGFRVDKCVTAWRSLPAPYKADTEGVSG